MGALSGDEGLRSDRLHGGIAGSAIGRGTTKGPRVDGRTWAWRGSGQASAETVKGIGERVQPPGVIVEQPLLLVPDWAFFGLEGENQGKLVRRIERKRRW